MRAGVGRADITPPVGIPAGGWGNQLHEISEGNDLELWATVLFVEGADGARAAIADIDLCLLDDAQAARARGVIAQAAGLPAERVAVGTTHNHSVPVTVELGGAWIRRNRELVAPYVESVFDAIGRAAAEAAAAVRPVRVGVGRGSSPLAVNRRMTKPDGRAAVGLNRDGVVDRTLTVMRLDGDDDRPVATIVHYGCHPIILGPDNRHVTPEYPGIVKRIVEESLGGHCLFVQGACGDVGPRELFVPDLSTYRRLGAMIGHEAAATALRSSWREHRQRLREGEASAWIASFEYEPDAEPDGTVAVAHEILPLPLRDDLGDPRAWRLDADRCEDEAYAARAAGAPDTEVRELTVKTKFARMRAERGEALAGLDAYPLLVHGIRLGPVALVGVPVELFCEIGMAIRDASPFGATLVSAYWNGYRNYLPTDAERSRGGYEIDISPFRSGADALVTAAAARVLRALT
ncbi:MAG: neutral/alkaline non-lysosomal ceramidase N-terminal domain-containing protein [Gaiellaceae bacterium]